MHIQYKMFSIIALVSMLLMSQCQASPPDTTVPTTNHGAKWRIGYYEGGPWVDYQGTLLHIVNGLATLGWIEALTFPDLPDTQDTQMLWAWLSNATVSSANVTSAYIEFVPDAYWSSNWDETLRAENKAAAIQRLSQEKDLDLVIAAGTWAGIDLANDQHDVPIIVISSSNPIQSGIIKSAEDSGYDHVFAKCDPERHIRHLRIFHTLVQFERLGILYEDSPDGRIYAALPDAEQVAQEVGFNIVTCIAPENDISLEEARANAAQCIADLAPRVDAFYVTAHRGLTPDVMPEILEPFFAYNVATWAQLGPQYVERGVLLSMKKADYPILGTFYAETIAKIFNGAKPRDLNQVFEEPKSITINLETARLIGYEPPSGLLTSAGETFEFIQGMEE